MIIAKMKQYKILKFTVALALILSVIGIQAESALAVTATDIANTKKQLDATKQQTVAKQKQAAELKTQVAIVDGQIGQAESAINQTQSQMATTNQSIVTLDKSIMDEQSNLDREQEKMSQILASWYMEGESGLLEAIVGADSLSEVMDKQQYYESLRQQIQINTERIAGIKADLNKQKDEQSSQLQVLTGLKQDQQTQQGDLVDKKSFKNRLLTDTTNTISSLSSQATALQKKIAEMEAQYAAAYAGGGVRKQGGDVLPVKEWWYQSQLTSTAYFRGTNVSVRNQGCFITSIAMIASFWGHAVTNDEIATKYGRFSSDGYLQDAYSLGYSLGINMGPLQVLNNSTKATFDNELNNGRPVIAGVLLDGWRNHPNSVGGYGFDHFIVIYKKVGNTYYMHDPANGQGYRMSDVVGFKTVKPM